MYLFLTKLATSALPVIWIFAGLLASGCQATPTAGDTAHTAATSALLDKTWKVQQIELKKQLGLIYKNEAAMMQELDAWQQKGVIIHLFDDGVCSMAEGPTVVFGKWTLDQKQKTIQCTLQRTTGPENVAFSAWRVNGNQLDVVFANDRFTVDIRAIADEVVLPKSENGYYPKQ